MTLTQITQELIYTQATINFSINDPSYTHIITSVSSKVQNLVCKFVVIFYELQNAIFSQFPEFGQITNEIMQ